MATTNLGRVQGGSVFYTSANSETTVNKDRLQPTNLAPLVGDTVIFFNGDLRSITAVSDTAVICSAVATSIKGPRGSQGQGFNFRGSWVNDDVYYKNDVVSYNGSTYILTGSDIIITPPASPDLDTTNWTLFTSKGDDAGSKTITVSASELYNTISNIGMDKIVSLKFTPSSRISADYTEYKFDNTTSSGSMNIFAANENYYFKPSGQHPSSLTFDISFMNPYQEPYAGVMWIMNNMFCFYLANLFGNTIIRSSAYLSPQSITGSFTICYVE